MDLQLVKNILEEANLFCIESKLADSTIKKNLASWLAFSSTSRNFQYMLL
jgi:hypothetical protein